jgi:hypothetical protein
VALFEECLIALKNKAIPLTNEETAKVEVILQNLFPFIFANINWEKVDKKIAIDIENPILIPNLKKILKDELDESIYLIWDTNVPVVKTNLGSVIAHFDDVTCVGTRTWFLNIHQGYVIEWHMGGKKVIGIANQDRIRQALLLKNCLDNFSSIEFISCDMYKLPRKMQRLLSRFIQIKYWNISSDYAVDEYTAIIPCIEKILGNPTRRNVFLLWNNLDLQMIRSDLPSVIDNWSNICKVQSHFQILDINADFLIDFSTELGIKIKFNFGLNSKKQ